MIHYYLMFKSILGMYLVNIGENLFISMTEITSK